MPGAPPAVHARHGLAARATTLAGAVESVHATIRLAAERGVSHARLALRPAELGSIDVHLRTTRAGLVATVHADSAQALSLLHQAAAELERSLEAQGVTLLRLDIGHREPEAGAARHEAAERRSAGGARSQETDSGAGEPDPTTTAETLELPSGLLVDVLA